MQNAITIILFAFLLMLLSVLPGWEHARSQRNAADQRAPVVIVDSGA